VAGMADADAQAMETAMAEQAHGVAQPVLAAVAAVELQPRDARRQVQLVVRQQRLLRLDLPELQRRQHGFAGQVHEGGGPEQANGLTANLHLGALAEQLGIQAERFAGPRRQGVHETEPGVVPGPRIFLAGVTQPDDETKFRHRAGAWPPRPQRARWQRRLLVLLVVVVAGDLGGRHLGGLLFALGRVFLFDLDAGRTRGHDRIVVVLAQGQLRDLDSLGQLEVRQVQGVAQFQRRQVHVDRTRQVLGQALDRDFPQLVADQNVGHLARRGVLFVDEVQRHRGAQGLAGIHALEVQVHDLLLVRVALDVAQQHRLHVAIQAQVQDRRVEPVVVAGQQHGLVAELDVDRGEIATVDDRGHQAFAAEAAARTLPPVLAALDLDFMSLGHVVLLPWLMGRLAAAGRLPRDQGSLGNLQSTYSELTDSPNAMRRMVSPRSSATLSWRMRSQPSAAGDSGMVSVTTSSSSRERLMFSMAAPDSTGWVQ